MDQPPAALLQLLHVGRIVLLSHRDGDVEHLGHVIEAGALFQQPDGEGIAEAMRVAAFDAGAAKNPAQQPIQVGQGLAGAGREYERAGALNPSLAFQVLGQSRAKRGVQSQRDQAAAFLAGVVGRACVFRCLSSASFSSLVDSLSMPILCPRAAHLRDDLEQIARGIVRSARQAVAGF